MMASEVEVAQVTNDVDAPPVTNANVDAPPQPVDAS